ncbi:MAG: cytochrome c biogenesis protein CcdA [Gemmatimonadales bacterium]
MPPEFGPDFVPIATTIEIFAVSEFIEIGAAQWPAPEPVTVRYTGSPIELLSYVDTAAVYLPVTIANDVEPGELSLELAVRYQACDEHRCYVPRVVRLNVLLTAVTADAVVAVQAIEPEVFAELDWRAFGADASPTMGLPPLTMSAFGWSFEFDPSRFEGLALLLMLAALGGFILNLTPCVLPVIPIKIMGLSRAAGDRSRLLLLGLVMSAGVVAFWIALGGAIAFITGFDAISSLFQTGWFALVVGVIVAVMALGMLGLFSLRLPQAVYRLDPGQETLVGSFGFGIMTAVLSTPCTAPFMGGASAWAATQAPPVTLATFGAIGFGMALPYAVLSARPRLVEKVPRSGPWSVLVKQVIGLVMLAVATFFIGTWAAAALAEPPEPPRRGFWWLVAGFGVVACSWLTFRTFMLSRSTARRGVVTAVAGAFAFTLLYAARGLSSHGPIDWVYYTPERFSESAAKGEVIVLDFTAEWCLNCKALESGVLHQDQIVELFEAPGIVPMRVDLTTDNPPGKAKLAQLDWVGIPLLAVYGPRTGYGAPLKYDSYTPAVVQDAVARARGSD